MSYTEIENLSIQNKDIIFVVSETLFNNCKHISH